jgi:hypothetical protein
MIIYKAVYAFDVDDTLAFEGAILPGNVIISDVARLRTQRCITGLCGNYEAIIPRFKDWFQYFSFYGPAWPGITKLNRTLNKNNMLREIMNTIRAEKYIMVGNKRNDPDAHPGSQDDVQAKLAGWDFIEESKWRKVII